ncbi:MAG: hypothetical protein IT328_15560 [Caldilineaceae bacterium]|nr:hypothetical protein [Caldilineaceae bacterium]
MLAGLVVLGWAGLHVSPAPFAAVTLPAAPPEIVPLPTGLPVPVERFYRELYGDEVPVIRSAVITGRGTMRIAPLFNLTFPARFRFTHEAGRSYRHYIEVTFFGMPVLKVNEYYVDGKERQELPWAVATDNPKLDQGGNVGMWAEIIQWLPSVLLTDPQVRWEPVDDDTALLVVPFGADEERFVVRFDPVGGGVQYWEVMRYLNGEGEKTLWVNGTWFDDGRPWFVVKDEEVVYNVAADTSVTVKGP